VPLTISWSVPPMAKHDATWWAERIEELAQGGDAKEIARRHGVRERTLIWWRSELVRRTRKKSRQRLLPVVVAPRRAETPRTELEIVVETGMTRMILRGCVSAEHVAAIVTAAARTC
jgi:transposase-like protein